MVQTFKNIFNVKVEPCPPQSQTKITIRSYTDLILLFPFISIHLKSTIYVTATSSLELSSSRCAAYQPYRDKGNGGKTEGHHICLKLGGEGDCSYCRHNTAWINTIVIIIIVIIIVVIIQSSAVVQKGMLGTWRTQCSGPGTEERHEMEEDEKSGKIHLLYTRYQHVICIWIHSLDWKQ